MAASVSKTIYGIISDAMHDAGLLGVGQQPSSEDLATNMRILNDLINLWQTQGLKLFLLQDIGVPLVAGQSKYEFSPTGDVKMVQPKRVIQGYMLNITSKIKRPLVPLAWDDWIRLSQVSGNDGQVSSYFVDKQPGRMLVHLWQPPDATEAASSTAHLLMQVAVTDPVNLESDIQFPQEWRIALRWGLADDICTGQPETIMNRCTTKSRAYRKVLEDFDVEDPPTRATPNMRGYWAGSFN